MRWDGSLGKELLDDLRGNKIENETFKHDQIRSYLIIVVIAVVLIMLGKKRR